jgi:uncharacterized OB-fold protein
MATCPSCKQVFDTPGTSCPQCGSKIPYLSQNSGVSRGAYILAFVASGALVYQFQPPFPFVVWSIGGIILAYAWTGAMKSMKH